MTMVSRYSSFDDSLAGAFDAESHPSAASLRQLTVDIATAEWRAVDAVAEPSTVLSVHLRLAMDGEGVVSLWRSGEDEQSLAAFTLSQAALARLRAAGLLAATGEAESAASRPAARVDPRSDPPASGNDFESIAAQLDAALADSAEPVGTPWQYDDAGWIDDAVSVAAPTAPGRGRRRRGSSAATDEPIAPEVEGEWSAGAPAVDPVRRRPRRSGALVLLILLLVGAGGTWWYLNHDLAQLPGFLHQPLRMLGVLPTQSTDASDGPGGIWFWQTLDSESASDAELIAAPSSPDESLDGPEPVVERSGSAPPTESVERVPLSETVPEPSVPGEEIDTSPSDAGTSGVEAPDTNAGASGTVELSLQFDADCWVEVSDANGRRLLFELAPAGQTRTVEGELPFTLAFGNARVVSLRLDGVVIDPDHYLPEQGSVVRFQLLSDPAAEAGVNIVSPRATVEESATTTVEPDAMAEAATESVVEPDRTPVVATPAEVATSRAVLLIRGTRPGVADGELLRILGSGSFAGRVRTLQLNDPPRGVVDILGADLAVDATATSDHPDVLQVRFGRHQDRVRIVLDLRVQRTVAAVAEGDQLIVR